MNDGEFMLDVKGFEGIYAVTNKARVYSYKRKKFIKDVHGNHNYRQICLRKEDKNFMYYLHRLVGEAFLELTNINPDGTLMKSTPEINHIDGDKNNCDSSNLEWCDRAYNMRHLSKLRKERKEA